jgi:hypothetical protein
VWEIEDDDAKQMMDPMSITGGLDNPLVEVEYKERQSKVILASHRESTLKIFNNVYELNTTALFIFLFIRKS